jgi:hypothetical protein
MLNAAGAQNSWKAGTGMKTMGKALVGLTTAKKPLMRRLRRDRDGEGRSGQDPARNWLVLIFRTGWKMYLELARIRMVFIFF